MTIGIVGLGYVGLPLAVAFAEAGHEVVGVELDDSKVASLERMSSYVEDIPDERLEGVAGRFMPTTRYADLARADAILVCVPTPLTANREPDLAPLESSADALAAVLQHGQLVEIGRAHV